MRNRLAMPKTLNGASNDITDSSIVQSSLSDNSIGKAMPALAASFDGIGANGYYPADANGDIGYSSITGKKYYMQVVNVAFQIWDVTNSAAVTSLYGPASTNTLWSGFGGVCETHNDGDPTVQFDHLANRWMVSQFAFTDPNDYHQCIAVSTSANPTGSWYRYDFLYSTTKFNDYPKFGVWPDGYYMSVNQYDGVTGNWVGAGAAVFNRTAMLNGLPATMIKFDLGAVVNWYGGMLPSDLDGPAPAVGSPNYFIEWDDSAWHGDPTDTLRVWGFHVNWATPANSTFGLNASFDPNTKIATANLDSDMCGGSGDCIPQPGTTQKLDAIASGQLMYRLQYRNFGAYQTLVGNQTVDATGTDRAGIYWFELRNTGTGWSMNQEGVYSPDTDNRWMGSVAMDKSGNMALGFSDSSSSTFPSIRYTGRLVSDPSGFLLQGEPILAVGGGSQIGGNRWGDYSMMAVDPADDCTFWYTQEYYKTTSFSNWSTRIGSFRFPSCSFTISGNAGIAGATMSYTDDTPKTVIADGSGNYSITVPSSWSGTVTPSLAADSFCPASQNYTNLNTSKTGQNYAHEVCRTFDPFSKWTSAFDLSHGWTVSSYVRTVGDVDGDGKADVIGFGQNGVYVALSNGVGFNPVSKWITAFDLAHGWTVAGFVRTVGDVNGDGKADVVGFGQDGVYVALS
ncbi:MAG: VCBS repeat-containing protein, partial [Chloroflexota bacterium]